MPIGIYFSFLFYLFTLVMTQTVHGINLMSLRWVALAGLSGASLLYWLFGRIRRRDALGNQIGPSMIWIYLLATLASVAAAENQVYSGLRWITQAMLLLTFMFLLRPSFHSGATGQLIWILKGITIVLLAACVLYPAPPTVFDNPFYRGAMGDSNSLGHITMVGALIFIHGAIIAVRPQFRLLQLGIGLVAIGILFSTWARSSMVSFLVGLWLLNHYYSFTRSFLAKSVTLLLVCFLIASPLTQGEILEFVGKDRTVKVPEQRSHILSTASGDGYVWGPTFEKVAETRMQLWSEAWEGFKQRPFLGWGFGANRDMPKDWIVSPTSTGLIRDVTNDVLMALEGSGVIGFLAYLGLMIALYQQGLTRQQLGGVRRRWNGSLGGQENQRRTLAEGKREQWAAPGKRDHHQAIFYTLSSSLFVLFNTDGSAFSPGSLVSAVFWVCTAAAGALRAEALAGELRKKRGKKTGARMAGSRGGLRNRE